jgi:uncharacterized protein (TIGR02246 family)
MNNEGPAHIHSLFLDAFNAGDIESLVALYEPNAVLVVNGQPVAGQQSIRNAYESFLARRPRMSLKTHSVAVFDGNLAVLHGDWVLEPGVADETGKTTRGLSTEVVRRQADGSWRFVIDIPYTPDAPGQKP